MQADLLVAILKVKQFVYNCKRWLKRGWGEFIDTLFIYNVDNYDDVLKKYSFESNICSDGNSINVSFYNDVCCITYHEYLQFGDYDVFVSNSLEDYQNHKYLRIYGLNWFVNNVLPDIKKINYKKDYSFIELVKFYIVKQLERNDTIFEIKIK